MKRLISTYFILLICMATLCLSSIPAGAAAKPSDFYQIRIYQFSTAAQESRLDAFLQNAYLPALHRAGIAKVGVFKPVGNDTATLRKIYLFIPFNAADQWLKIDKKLAKDNQFVAAGSDYIDAKYDDPPYSRVESILLNAFVGMPSYGVPALSGPKNERIYELRSYEGATEKIHANKVNMFNVGDEVGLFKRLGFNAVFYAEVVSGAHMPNLMYMTSFENMATHDQLWKNFGDDAYWKKLSKLPEYQNNVSHIDIVLMHPAAYSDL